MCFLDFLGVSIAGSKMRSGHIIKNVMDLDNKTPIVSSLETSPLESCLINGVYAHSMDLDDGHRLAHLHPGSVVIPAALAAAEKFESNGKDFLTAIIIGYQISIFMGMLVNPEHRLKGFHSTGTCGTFGAAATVSKLMKLDQTTIINALGLAGTQAAGLLESDHAGSMGKHLHAGKAAQAGFLSALLANNGFTGAQSIIEGDEGFLSSMSTIPTDEKIDSLKNLLFNSYFISGVYLKKYPVCRHLHSAIDAAISLRNENRIEHNEIIEINIETYKIASEHDNYQPETTEAIRQSLPIIIALSICKGEISTDNLTLNKNVEDIASKVKINYNPEFELLYPEKRVSKLKIKTKRNTYEKTVHLPRGEPEKPFKWDDVYEKFESLNPNYNINSLKILKNMESRTIKEMMKFLNYQGE
jgi:2-methylcitrate dehydratase PrpD